MTWKNFDQNHSYPQQDYQVPLNARRNKRANPKPAQIHRILFPFVHQGLIQKPISISVLPHGVSTFGLPACAPRLQVFQTVCAKFVLDHPENARGPSQSAVPFEYSHWLVVNVERKHRSCELTVPAAHCYLAIRGVPV